MVDMDVWIVINPVLTLILYVATFGSVGSFLFSFHFRELLTKKQRSYCYYLARKSTFFGATVSLLLILSVAGNLGGDIASVTDVLMLQLAIESKSGIGHLIAFSGFVSMIIAQKIRTKATDIGLFVASLILFFSFTIAGHSLLGGALTKLLLIVHLFCVAFWLGALLPFRWICLQADKANLTGLARRFGVIATFYVGLLLSAGFTYAYVLLEDFSLVFSSNYGNTLLIKIGLVGLLLSLAAFNKFKLIPSLEENFMQGVKKFKSSVQIEIFLASLILFTSSLLTTSIMLPTS
tara:strand:+ start:2093 stop:2968 length:876 start_codon:yes stop_codon:yes gene_type:complete